MTDFNFMNVNDGSGAKVISNLREYSKQLKISADNHTLLATICCHSALLCGMGVFSSAPNPNGLIFPAVAFGVAGVLSVLERAEINSTRKDIDNEIALEIKKVDCLNAMVDRQQNLNVKEQQKKECFNIFEYCKNKQHENER